MIVSHEHRFIFIKTEKTAGTSIEIALSKHCGSQDILTPVSPEDEAMRQSLGFPGAQNHYTPLHHWTGKDWRRALFRFKRPTLHSHTGAQRIRTLVGEDVWKGYFKFCFERNPWDKLLSWYYWTHRNTQKQIPLDVFLSSPQARKIKGFDLYTIEGEVAVDKIYRFEEINAAMSDIAERIGLSNVPELPFAKASHRKDRRSYQDIFSPEGRDVVQSLYQREIDLLGYEW